MRHFTAALAIVLISLFMNLQSVEAGGGPENVVVVVNADSWASVTIANEFVYLRQIPSSNVIYLSGIKSLEVISVDDFREKILLPVLKTIEKRKLAAQTDYIVYSSDFPYSVNISSDLKGKPVPRVITQVASLNGLTYLYQYVMAKSPNYVKLDVNRYYRRPLPLLTPTPLTQEEAKEFQSANKLLSESKWTEAQKILEELSSKYPKSPILNYSLARLYARDGKEKEAIKKLKLAIDEGWMQEVQTDKDPFFKEIRLNQDFREQLQRMERDKFEIQPTTGFRSAVAWDAGGKPIAEKAPKYMLSTMLAMTSLRGNSVQEALDSLRRSVSADGSKPNGTIYYMKNNDVRSKARDPIFPDAVARLKELGIKAEVIQGKVPVAKSDVAGTMMGIASFNWGGSGSKIRAGAICDHLTSFGGVMKNDAGQTPLSEYIRHGAAGASGTVVEPYAIQAKFPFPFIHAHYAQGCSLAESFYQSVYGPYQLLIVGDPLCKPWGKIPRVKVSGIDSSKPASGTLIVNLEVDPYPGFTLSHYELFVDGLRKAVIPPAAKDIKLDTKSFPDGHHELRFVAVSKDAIRNQGRAIVPVTINNQGNVIKITKPTLNSVTWNGNYEVKASIKDGKKIMFFHNRRMVGSIDGSSGKTEINLRAIGQGNVKIEPMALIQKDGQPVTVVGEPFNIKINPPIPLPDLKLTPTDISIPGFWLQKKDGKKESITSTKSSNWLTEGGVKANEDFEISGNVYVNESTVHQFQILSSHDLEVQIDGKVGYALSARDHWHFVPVSLGRGNHRFLFKAKGTDKPKLQIRFGGIGSKDLGSQNSTHGPK